MKIVITGGSGFIGTNLIKFLETKHYSLKNIDIQRPVCKSQLKYWEEVDILNESDLYFSLRCFEPDIIIHLAAITDINGKNLEYYSANFLGTQNLIEASKTLNNVKKIIFTSTQYVCKLGYIPQHFEDYCPHTIYGESKVEMEKIIRKIENPSYEWVIIRPTSIWGPWFKYPYRKFFDIIHKGVYLDMTKTANKTYGYVKNSVYQIERLIHVNNIGGRTFYIGDLPAYHISDWAKEINKHLHKKKMIVIPIFLMKLLAYLGDVLKRFNIYFPMNSFRLKNMITDNVMPLSDLYKVVGTPPYSRLQGTIETIDWLKNEGKYV